MIGTFGPVTFVASADILRTLNGFTRKREGRYAVHDVANGKPRLEFTGPGLYEVSFSMRFDAAFGLVPKSELDALAKIRDEGRAEYMIIGRHPIGRFVITGLDEAWTRIDGAGRLLVATVNVSLKEYVS